MKKVLVAGAAGFIGIRVCEIFYDAGYTVYALALPDEDTSALDEYVTDCLKGNLLVHEDCRRLESWIEENTISYIVSLVGGVDYHHDYETSRRINVATAEALAGVAVNLYKKGILKKMIFGGSVAARGFFPAGAGKDHLVNEDTDDYRKGLAVYCDVKREAEEIILNAVKEEKLPACIVQPGSLVGPERGGRITTTVGLIRRALKGVPVLSGGASYTSVRALAAGILAALEKGSPGETWLFGGENMTMKDFSLLVRHLAREHCPCLKVSSFPLLNLSPRSASFLGKLNIAMNSQQALLGSAFHYIDSSKAAGELGYLHSRDELEKMILETLKVMENQIA